MSGTKGEEITHYSDIVEGKEYFIETSEDRTEYALNGTYVIGQVDTDSSWPIYVRIDKENKDRFISYTLKSDDPIGSWRVRMWEIVQSESLQETLTNKSKNIFMNIVSKIKNLLETEPTKTYKKLGVLDGDGNLTSEGQALALKLWWESKDCQALAKPLCESLLEEDQKNSK